MNSDFQKRSTFIEHSLNVHERSFNVHERSFNVHERSMNVHNVHKRSFTFINVHLRSLTKFWNSFKILINFTFSLNLKTVYLVYNYF
jgi:hypothetical protein